jgi:1-acyl-sn-glycerol-3-phosphate acyltransferase
VRHRKKSVSGCKRIFRGKFTSVAAGIFEGIDMKRTKKNADLRYDHSELPPVKNWILFHYRAFMKLFFIFLIGAGSIILAVFVFPWIKVFVHPKKKFQETARKFVSACFRGALFLMNITGIVKIYTADKKKFRSIHSKVIVANHCSILDFVILMSLIPNANCIVRESLRKTPLAGVVTQAYILNSEDLQTINSLCRETLDMGNNVIIFPEGTRTPRHGNVPYKKGAARVARFSGCDILPVLIAGGDKFGLGKNDPFWSFNHVEPLIYDLQILDEIKIRDYENFSTIVSAKKITEEIRTRIQESAKKYNENHPHCKTLNNV